jgi:hypothetical protein
VSVLTPLLTQGVNTMNEIVITICLDPNDQSWGYYTIGSAPGFSVQGAGGIAHEVGGVWTNVSGPGSAYIGCDTPTEVPAEVKVAFGITCPATSPTTTGRDHGLLPRLDHRKSPGVVRGGELVSSVSQVATTTSFSCWRACSMS